MLTYLAATDVALSLTVPASATTLRWTLTDEVGVALATNVNTSQTGGVAAITVPANLNDITGQRGARVLKLSYINNGVTLSQDVTYLLEKEAVLALMTNSFQTYEQALIVRAGSGMTLLGWDLANKSRQCASLETAFHRLCKISYKFSLDEADAQEYDLENPLFDSSDGIYRIVRNIAAVTVPDFMTFPTKFVEALCRAQLVEANIILGGDIVGDKRASGIQSETIGESSMFFRSGAPLDLPVSRVAFNELTGYIYRRAGITRG